MSHKRIAVLLKDLAASLRFASCPLIPHTIDRLDVGRAAIGFYLAADSAHRSCQRVFVNKTLMDRGIPEEALKAVHTPIGTPIRAVTPAEIAVSILGELILCRAEIREGEMPAHHGCPMHG